MNWAYALEANEAIKAMGANNFMINERVVERGQGIRGEDLNLHSAGSLWSYGSLMHLGTEVAARSHHDTIASYSNAALFVGVSSSSMETIR